MIRSLYEASVFKRMPSDVTPADAIVTYFHRASATKYFILTLWGVASAVFGINTFVIIWDRPIQAVYSVVVAVMSILACVGATWYGKRKKLELFAGSGVLVLMVGYTLALAYRLLVLHDTVVGAQVIFSIGVLVLPACRTVFIFKWGARA